MEVAIREAFNDLKTTNASNVQPEVLSDTDDVMDTGDVTMQAVEFIGELVESGFPEALARRAWQAKHVAERKDG